MIKATLFYKELIINVTFIKPVLIRDFFEIVVIKYKPNLETVQEEFVISGK